MVVKRDVLSIDSYFRLFVNAMVMVSSGQFRLTPLREIPHHIYRSAPFLL